MVVAIGVSPYATSLPRCSGPFCCLLLDLDVDLGPWLFIWQGPNLGHKEVRDAPPGFRNPGSPISLHGENFRRKTWSPSLTNESWRAIPVPSTSSGRTSYTYRSTGHRMHGWLHIRGFSAERQPKSATRASESGLMVWRSLVTKTSTCSHCGHFLLDFVPDFCKANVMSICGTPISPEN